MNDIGVSVTGKGTLKPQAQIPSLDSLEESFRKGEYRIGGDISLSGCGSILIGHCEAIVGLKSQYSNQEGFDILDADLDGDCGAGGCSN